MRLLYSAEDRVAMGTIMLIQVKKLQFNVIREISYIARNVNFSLVQSWDWDWKNLVG